MRVCAATCLTLSSERAAPALEPESEFFVRELVEDHILRVPYVATAENLADFFTKSLNPVQFIAIRNRIMNVRVSEDSTTTPSSQ